MCFGSTDGRDGAELDERPVADARDDRDGHVGRLAGRARARVVRVEVSIDVGEPERAVVCEPQRRGDARHERAAASEHDEEGVLAQQRLEPVADPAARLDDRPVAEDPALGIALGPDDAHREIARVAGAERLHDAELAQRGRRELGAARRAVRVDRDADDDGLARAGARPRQSSLPSSERQSRAISSAASSRSERAHTSAGECMCRSGIEISAVALPASARSAPSMSV